MLIHVDLIDKLFSTFLNLIKNQIYQKTIFINKKISMSTKSSKENFDEKNIIRPVYISAYDLSMGFLSNLNLNMKHVFHTCIEIGDFEYYFQNDIKIRNLLSESFNEKIFVEAFCPETHKKILKQKSLKRSDRYNLPLYTALVGYTFLSDEEIEQTIRSVLTQKYTFSNYHLLYNNCNNFSNEMLYLICSKTVGVPIFILNQTREFLESDLSKNPMICSLLNLNSTQKIFFEQHDNLKLEFKYKEDFGNHIEEIGDLTQDEKKSLFYKNFTKKTNTKSEADIEKAVDTLRKFLEDEK